MARYVAFLRGVSPVNARMPELKSCFEAAGFTDVRTVLTSGNVIFNSRSSSSDRLEKKAEAAMQAELDRSFSTIVRSVDYLRALIESDPFSAFRLAAKAKPVITFLRQPGTARIKLPIERDGARILRMTDGEILSAYIPNAKGPAFMTLLERTFGKEITTRTLDTVKKCAIS